MDVKISDVIMCSFELAISRDSDVDTGDGCFATCGIGEIIRLDESIAHYFEVGSDDVSISDVDTVLRKAKELDSSQELIAKQVEKIKVLRKALSDVAECGFIPHHCEIIVNIALETTKD